MILKCWITGYEFSFNLDILLFDYGVIMLNYFESLSIVRLKDVKIMGNIENDSSGEIEEPMSPIINLSKRFQAIFTLIAILSSITGFIAIITILAQPSRGPNFLYPHGFLIGLLLLIGGLILLSGVLILRNESLNVTDTSSLHEDKNEPFQ
jgi:hypothetical protein